MLTIVVIAKECVAGRVKTRLHPPLTLEQAAEVAAASLADTLEFVSSLPADRRVIAFAGTQLPSEAHGFDVIPQVEGDLDVRLGAVFDAVEGPMILIGMDTPQLTREHLDYVLGDWSSDAATGPDAWFGPASDGGWWGLALREPTGDVLRGVPMSRDDTGALQLASLGAAGLRVGFLPEVNDVDTYQDALEVAALAPGTRFAQALSAIPVTPALTA
ncbi:DUF2064 domain-containing protein [Herbiconiux sp. CPCC 203407]|uniref:DUF2064 domain-containing protein n=1 Tax=Herbiconiux oxytropis TaxID=2970915 RepID=A0AA42BWZ2_9MICO|nr:DUF2064 domain-containing protein [Herbiconiux oxytropis]MCS5723852.1 DUF2064 domain-containing protein [Herbiconiux oxytropis]MCS5727658.1 DUF2064 domain-containing protein [Herbiconiux oxytropis]